MISENDYIGILRKRLGVDSLDTSMDSMIDAMPPMKRVGELSGWYLGDPYWADLFLDFFKSQGFTVELKNK